MARIEFTRAWSDEEKEAIKPRLKTVLQHFPEFDGKKVKIGRTEARGKLGVYPREANEEDRRYIRIRPEASHHTIAHELIHVVTREKAVDILSLARHPDLNDGKLSYLDVPEYVKHKPEKFSEHLFRVASTAEKRFSNRKEMVDWFEETVEEKAPEWREKL